MKVLAIGDIHTKLWMISEARKLIDNYDHIVFVGDYADDWHSTPQDTIDTWQALKDFQDEYPRKVTLVVGNHDWIYVNKTSSISGGYNQITQHLLNVPERKELKAWLKTMKVGEKLDHIVYSHAGYVDEWDSSEHWDDLSPLWVRPQMNPSYNITFPHKGQVFGHTPSETCWEVQPNVWCIDTFSTYRDGTPIGDQTVLEIIDGKTFNKIKMEKPNDNNPIDRLTSRLS